MYIKLVIFLLLGIISIAFVKPINAEEFTLKPERVVIPSVNIDLPVNQAEIIFNTWEVRLDGASFGEGSALPGNKGNTVIFSHALPDLFGNLPQIKKDDLVNVFTKNDWFVYKVTKIQIVNPDQTDILNADSNHEITLFTCVGPNYSQRFVVKAELIPNIPSLQ